MANPFADLIPSRPAAPQAAVPRANPFADLVPAKNQSRVPMEPQYSAGDKADATIRGAVDTATFGYGDEIAGGLGGAVDWVRGNVLGEEGRTFQGGYKRTRDNARRIDAQQAQDLPGYRMAGQIAGAVPGAFVPGANIARGVGLGGKMVRGAAHGAVQGGLYGAGSADGDLADRGRGAIEGAKWGAGIGGAVPVVGRAIGKAVGKRAGAAAVPTSNELKDQSQQLYKVAKDSGVGIQPQSFVRAVDGMMVKLREAGINAKQQPKSFETFSILRRARDAAAKGSRVDLQDMERLRQIAGGVLKDIDANERRVSHVIIDGLDDFMTGLKGSDITANQGNAKVAIDALKGARDLWTRKSKSELVEKAFERAKNAVGANYTSAGMQTALRQQFKQIANNEKVFRRFSNEERAAILKAVRGGPVENLLRKIGKFAPTGYLTGAGTIGAGATFGVVPAAAGAAGTLAARGAATRMATNSANRADALIRNGGQVPFDAARAAAVEGGIDQTLAIGRRGAAQPALVERRPLELTVSPRVAR